MPQPVIVRLEPGDSLKQHPWVPASLQVRLRRGQFQRHAPHPVRPQANRGVVPNQELYGTEARTVSDVVLQVVEWDNNFEKAASRIVDRCSWICAPNHLDGDGLTFILQQPDGAAIYGIWNLIIRKCSQQKKPRHGYLTADGTPMARPWHAHGMAGWWRREIDEVERALEVLSHDPVNWLQPVYERAMSTLGACHERAIGIKEGKNERKKERRGAAPDLWEVACRFMASPILRTPQFETAWREWVTYRAERKPALTERAIGKQIPGLEALGHDGAIERLNNAIANGWQGCVFAEDRQRSANAKAGGTGGHRAAARGREYPEPDCDLPRL